MVQCYVHNSLTLALVLAILSHSIQSHPISLRSILVLSSQLCLGLPSGLFPSHFPTKTLPTNVFFHMHDTSPTHSSTLISSPRLYLVTTTSHEAHQCTIFCIRQLLAPSSSSPYSWTTLSLCSFPNMRDQVSYPYNIYGTVTALQVRTL